MPSSLSIETAQRIAACWGVARERGWKLADVMREAGLKTADARNHNRYRRITEELLGITLPSLAPKHGQKRHYPHTTEQVNIDKPYTVVIFSDAHWWPNSHTPAFSILLKVIKELKPAVVIDNGDSWDGASISRHDPITFENLPSLADEYAAVRGYLGEIKDAAGKAQLYRNVGNHDLRFEAYLAKHAGAMQGMPGTTVHELFPDWAHNYSIMLNDSLFIKHRWKGGVHAAWNNTLWAGKSIATGHTHRLTVREFTDLRGTRYGIECGTLADPYGPQFAYCEDNPVNWQQGFMVLTIDGQDIYPERVEVKEDKAWFRGQFVFA